MVCIIDDSEGVEHETGLNDNSESRVANVQQHHPPDEPFPFLLVHRVSHVVQLHHETADADFAQVAVIRGAIAQACIPWRGRDSPHGNGPSQRHHLLQFSLKAVTKASSTSP